MELHRALSAEGILGLIGMGGIGKTQLTAEYAYRYRQFYTGGVFWVDASRPLVDGLGEQQPILGKKPDAQGALDKVNEVGTYLRLHPDSLLVLDNLADPAQLNVPIAPGLVLGALQCHLLYTTRQKHPGLHGAFEVQVLSAEAAMELLLQQPTRRAALDQTHPDHAEARAICATLGYLPLALQLAAAHLGLRPEASLAAYHRDLVQRRSLLVLDDPQGKVRAEDLPTRHRAAVAATLEEQCKTLSPQALLLLRVIGLLPQAAQMSQARLGLLAGLSDEEPTFFGSPMSQAISEIESASLIGIQPSDKRITVHPLIHEFAAILPPSDGSPDLRQACAARVATVYQDVATLEAHCNERGVDAVQEDLTLALGFFGDPKSPEESELKAKLAELLTVLRREAHALRGCLHQSQPAFFAQQVHNRAAMQGFTQLAQTARERLAQISAPHLLLRWWSGRESQAMECILSGHKRGVTTVAVASEAHRVISASMDRALKVWDLNSGAEMLTLSGHEGLVRSVAVTPDGRRLVSGSDDGMLRVWSITSDPNTGLTSASILYNLAAHDDLVNGVAITPDGSRAITASSDKTLVVWDLSNGREQGTLLGHEDWVNSVTVTADGKKAISASSDGSIRVWDLRQMREEGRLKGHQFGIHSFALSSDGHRGVSASYDGCVKVWDMDSFSELLTMPGYGSRVNALAMIRLKTDMVMCGMDDASLRVWNPATEDEVLVLHGHEQRVTALATTQDGRRVISASADRTLRVWDLNAAFSASVHNGIQEPDRARHERAVTAIATYQDEGPRAITASEDGTMRVWDLLSGRELLCLSDPGSLMSGVAVTKDGQHAVSSSSDPTANIWDLRAGTLVGSLSGHSGGIGAIAVSPDGHRIVSASSDKTLKVWDLQQRAEILTLKGHESGASRVVITESHQKPLAISASFDKTLRIWDLTEGNTVQILTDRFGQINDMAVASNPALLVLASSDGLVRLWNLDTGGEVPPLEGHTGSVTAVSTIPNGQLVISASEDGTLRVWDAPSRHDTALIMLSGTITSLEVVNGEGSAGNSVSCIVAGDGTGAVYCLDYCQPARAC